MCWTPDDKRVLAGLSDGRVVVVNALSAAELGETAGTEADHDLGYGSVVAISAHPAGNLSCALPSR